ncbi:condensin complex subunit 3 isoform X2 [Carica papaya]|uniref:condensin complex subunit 3 isoform X2 n=1 Tax=Carica papaya TaxID=3649 RepID=UPI000B8D05A3|nr:condensin complex subunit 3 isoform X2 [Carica papaya]
MEAVESQLMQKMARIFDEARTSYATHNRKLKELAAIRSKVASIHQFSAAFAKTLTPLFQVQRRTASAERVVRFVSVFTGIRGPENISACEVFLEDFLRFLLVGAGAANKTARFRCCQIISEIILRLPDDTEVSNELWDDVIECLRLRVGDKVPLIRTFAVRGLSRFLNDSENMDVLDLLLEVLPLEQNAEVRKAIVLSLPPSNSTSQAIIDATLDVSEYVRKAAYCVLANKFPLQSLSIKLRTIILQRGLVDRCVAVSNECLKLMKDQWLTKSCNGDPVELLKYLDVETYESVGESVMVALLSSGSVKLHECGSIQQYISSACDQNGGSSTLSTLSIQLMEPEVALYWRTLCRHLQMKAQEKGSDAAATMGTEAAVYAAEASDNNDLLEQILPATVSDYVSLVKAHIDAGPNYRFASRQLLLIGSMLDFSDVTIRKVASSFVQDLLQMPLEHEIDENGNNIIIGDGINLGGDKDWAGAVSVLVRKVHAAAGEFEEILLGVVEELAKPCRERTADFMQWIHSLAITGLLLEGAKSLRWIQGKATDSAEILHTLLLPAAKHVHLDVQRIAIRCLGLFGLLENKPSEELVKQLRLSVTKGPPPISIMACKALIDLGMWHGPQEVDKAMGKDLLSQFEKDNLEYSPVNFSDADGDLDVKLLDLLFSGLEDNDWNESSESHDNESVRAILAEGFAKFLLLSEKYPSISASCHPVLLAKLITIYFSDESKELQRLKQCLSVFFEHYASLSMNHKECVSRAFLHVMRSMWPGINGNPGGSPAVVSKMRKRAVQASKFMLQMIQAPLYIKETEVENEAHNSDLPETIDNCMQYSLECGEEGLAIRIATEVGSFHAKKTPAERAYVSALCKILGSLHFQSSDQEAIKLMHTHPDQTLLQDQANSIFGRLGVDFKLDVESTPPAVPETPAARSTRQTRSRRPMKHEETSSDEEDSPATVQFAAATTPGIAMTRSQRASKTAALSRMTSSRAVEIDEEEEEEEGSEVTSDGSDESEQLSE